MMMWVFIAFIGTMLIGLPLVFAMGLAGLIGSGHISLTIMAQQLFLGLNNFSYVAIPLFILMGNLMTECGLTDRLINFCNSIFGRFRGGLAIASMAAGAFFAAISGSSVACTASLGSVLIPSMKREGYGAGFAGAVIAAAGSLGPIIPPSILLVIYASQTGNSVSAMFAAGVIPGVLSALLYMVVAYRISTKRKFPVFEKTPISVIGKTFIASIPAIIIPAIILAGVIFGIFTVTESAGIVVIYAFVFCIINKVKGSTISKLTLSAFKETASVTFVIGASSLLAWVITRGQLPQKLVGFMTEMNFSVVVVFILINLIFVILGMLMAPAAALVLATPLLLPLATAYGMSSIQFGMVMVYNLNLGVLTPPVAISLFMTARMSGTSFEEQVKEVMPFFLISIVVLILLNVFPPMSLALASIL